MLCTSVERLKEYKFRKKLGTPTLYQWFLTGGHTSSGVASIHFQGARSIMRSTRADFQPIWFHPIGACAWTGLAPAATELR